MAKKQSFFMKIIQICQAFFTLDGPHPKASTRRPFLLAEAQVAIFSRILKHYEGHFFLDN
jgi:hypothetical protein